MNNYQLAISELSLSGGIGLGNCSASTVYRWEKEINRILEAEKYDWRVKADVKARASTAVLMGRVLLRVISTSISPLSFVPWGM